MNSCQTYDNPGENVDIIVRESSPYKRLIKKCKHVENLSQKAPKAKTVIASLK